MDIRIGYKRDFITYGTVVSLMLDYSNSNEMGKISYDPDNCTDKQSQNIRANFMEYLTSKKFLFTHGVFNEYCFLHKFKNAQDFRDNYLNTAFIILPAFEFESMDNLNKLIKKAKKTGISEYPENDEISKKQILDNYKKFTQEIQTNHDQSLKLMKKNTKNNIVNYYDCFQLMHLKSGNFLEYKRNSKDLMTYIKLSSTMSKRTLFRFIPPYEYQTDNSTNVFFYLSVQIASGIKKHHQEKYICSKKSKKKKRSSTLQRSILDSFGVSEEDEDKIIKEEKYVPNKLPKKSIFDGEDLKNIIKDVYQDVEPEEKIIDEFVTYSINENIFQKNFGNNLMPEGDYLIMYDDKDCFWRLINLSEDYFEDLKYINLFDYFCIQSPDKNLFVHIEMDKNEEQNMFFLGDNSNNSKNGLKPIKEEDEKEDIKTENKEENEKDKINIIVDSINSEKKEEENNIINTNIDKNSLSVNPVFINSKNVNNSILDYQIQLDYYYETNVNSNNEYKLQVESYGEKEHLKPYSLFRFEPINEDFEKGEYGFGSFAKFSVVKEKTKVRIFNTFTNKVLCAEKAGKNKYQLILIDDLGKKDRRYPYTIFEIEQLDSQDTESEESKSEKEEYSDNEESENNKNEEEEEKKEGIKKNNFIKIKSNKYSSYIGIRLKNDNNCGELILTNSIADITRFKLNCIDEEDKHEVNFFEQLLLGFNDILYYFRQENKLLHISGKSYEKITNILTKFKNKLFVFQKDEKEDSNLNLQENKFDFLEIIAHFNIVSKLIDIFLTNWFQNYQIYTYNQLEEKLKKYFQENKDILKYKLIISKVILEILTKIYDLENSYLNIIEDSLTYFLMFVGRDDRCTSFLIHILNNNAFLLVSLCPLYKDNLEMNQENIEIEGSLNELNNMSLTLTMDNEEIQRRRKRYKKLKYYNIKKCLERIIDDYNNMTRDKLRINFYSINLFFVFMSTLLIFKDAFFQQFYDDYFSDLGLLKKLENSDMKVPNYENNPILTYFYLRNGEIYVKSLPFKNNDKKVSGRILDYKLTDLVDIIANYNLENEENRNLLFFAKLVNINLVFYSHLSICDEEFKQYLLEIFKFENITNNFFTFTYNIINNPDEINTNLAKQKKESPLLNDTKCSVIQILTFLYLKKRKPYITKTHLFKCINGQNDEENTEINILELNKIIKFIIEIFENKDDKFQLNKIDQVCLIQFIELIKFVLRNLYIMKNNRDQTIRNNIYILIGYMIKLLQNIIGISEEDLERNEREERKKQLKKEKMQNPDDNDDDYPIFFFEEQKQKTLEDTLNDKLDFKNPMLVVSENFEYVFIKIKKKLEKLIKEPKEKINEVNLFLNILRDICDSNIIQKTRYDLDLAKKIKKNKKLLKRFDLKSILMNISVLNNRNDTFLFNSILYRIEEIIREFLQYLEYSTMETLGQDIVKTETFTREDYLKGIKLEIRNRKISSKYLEEFRNKMYNKNSSIISFCFFKFLQVIENATLRELALEIIFYLNSSKNIFYYNCNNLVIMEDLDQYNKFLVIKNIFVELFDLVNNLNMAPRLDKNTMYFIEKLSTKIKDLLQMLFDDNAWTEQNNALNKGQDFEFEDSVGLPKENSANSVILYDKKKDEEEDDKEDEKEGEINLFSKESKSNIENSKKNESNNDNYIKSSNSVHTIEEKIADSKEMKNKMIKIRTDKYFMNEFDKENLKIFQQTLYNLDFLDFASQFFEYIDKLTEFKSDLEGDFKNLEEAIISIYKILVAFSFKNNKMQSFIKLRLYLLICPLKFRNISTNLLYSINYFIFHLVYNFKSKVDHAKISNIEDVIDKLYLLHQLDWKKHKRIMPYFFQTLLIFFEYSTPEHIFSIFTLLDDIKNVVIDDILSGKFHKNSIIILIQLLEFIESEHFKKRSKEYKYRPLLSMSKIIKAFPKLNAYLLPKKKIDLKKLVYSRALILITNIVWDNYDIYYQNDFELNKNEIFDSLNEFCKKLVIGNEFIYTGSIDKKNKYINHIKNFNEFMGISLPKLYILLDNSDMSDCSWILEKSHEFYQKILKILEINNSEKIFLDESYNDEITEIFEHLKSNSISEKLKLVLQRILDIMNMSEENKDQSLDEEDNLIGPNTKQFSDIESIQEGEEENFIEENSDIYYNLANSEIQEERKNYILKLFNFFDFINTNNNKKEAINNDKDVCFYNSFCESYTKMFGKYTLKTRIFFLYWTNILIMNFDPKEKKILDDNPIFNKKFFSDSFFAGYTIQYFEKMNLNINNYENFIYIKFMSSYLYKLDAESSAKFVIKLIEMNESRKIYQLLHNILDNLFEKINYDINEMKYQKDKYIDICPSSINEKRLDDSLLAVNFLTYLSEDNRIIKNKMKDYLRLQYNNSKNHNFIIILSNILEIFAFEKNLKYIPKHFKVIIAIINCLTKLCSGPCKGNQDCIVKNTHVLELIKFILQKVHYRAKEYDNNGVKYNELDNGLRKAEDIFINVNNRRMLSYLKFRLLILLNILTVGRKKGDKIFDMIHQVIDFDVLTSVLIETYKEILIETKSQKNPENCTYEESILSRMDDLNAYLNDPNRGNKFIIYENGTFSYLLINIYLENLTRPMDINSHNAIMEIKQKLENKKCKIEQKSHFESFVKSMVDYYDNLKKCFKKILGTCGKCFEENNDENDFPLPSSLSHAFSFFFENTPHIEILNNGKIIKYYIKLSPICKCLTEEMKEEFHDSIDRASAKTKTAELFSNVEFFRAQLIMNKKILDAFNKAPILNLFFNHYLFYRNIFLIVAVIINLLIFMSYYRITDDEREVTSEDYDLQFDYGFLYKKENIKGTKVTFLVLTIIELVFAVLILVNYVIFRVSYFIYYNTDRESEEEKFKKLVNHYEKNKEIFKYLMERFGTFIKNLILDIKLLYHLFLLIIIILTLSWDRRYKILSVLLLDIIERSSTLMCIVKSFWIPKKQIIVTLLLFYLVAYYFIILVYLFIPYEVPKHDCFKFSDCYFTLCDQAIKNSNGIINYLIEEGLYIYDSLWGNPRFWIDNWFAILDVMLVMQMFCGIIIDTYLSQREKNRDIEKDKNNVCFVCGLNKNELNKYYSSEFGFNEHIKLDHYLWNYMFVVFNVTSRDESTMLDLDKLIKRGYETNVYSSWVPYKKCLNQMEIDSKKKENEDEEKENNEEEED